MTFSSQQRPQVWKSSAKVVPLIVYSARVLQNWFVVQSAPQCNVDPKVSGPPPFCLGYPTFPLLSMMSISPLAGQSPYSKNLGMSQMAGHSQSPLGSLALTSILPQIKVKDSTVVSFPLRTGQIQSMELLVQVIALLFNKSENCYFHQRLLILLSFADVELADLIKKHKFRSAHCKGQQQNVQWLCYQHQLVYFIQNIIKLENFNQQYKD